MQPTGNTVYKKLLVLGLTKGRCETVGGDFLLVTL
jgi:hypothetical protein